MWLFCPAMSAALRNKGNRPLLHLNPHEKLLIWHFCHVWFLLFEYLPAGYPFAFLKAQLLIYMVFISQSLKHFKKEISELAIICKSVGHVPSPFPKLVSSAAMLSPIQNFTRLFLLVSPSQSYWLPSTTHN